MVSINNIADLKNRTLMESNTFKSFVLSSQSNDFTNPPSLNDILIHEFQTANSITLNSILSNFIVNLKYAWTKWLDPQSMQHTSYFQVRREGESYSKLDDEVRLLLDIMDDGTGTFKSRYLEMDAVTMTPSEGISRYISLGGLWYGVQKVALRDNEDDDKLVLDSENNYISTENLVLAPEPLNDFTMHANPYGTNPFDAPGWAWDDEGNAPDEPNRGSFNEFMKVRAGSVLKTSIQIDCIVENLFKGNQFDCAKDDLLAKWIFPESEFIVCAGHGIYALEMQYDNGKFVGMMMWDIGKLIPNLD